MDSQKFVHVQRGVLGQCVVEKCCGGGTDVDGEHDLLSYEGCAFRVELLTGAEDGRVNDGRACGLMWTGREA